MPAAQGLGREESSGGPTFTLIAVIVLVIGGLWILDFFLARTERDAVQSEAKNLFLQGISLIEQHRAADAVDPLRRASSMVRDNRQYELAYVTALVDSGKLDEADSNLKTLLQADPDNGPANLQSARLLVKQGKIAEAESHYHRAIYGTWPDKAPGHRNAARMELADLLASHGQQEELLAELLALEAEVHDAGTLEKIANLYLAAGSAARATAIYRQLTQTSSDASLAYEGLGRAELAQGDYRAAFSAFMNASREGASGASIERGINLTKTLTSIDPTPRRLSSSEKYARSLEILKMARDALDRCIKSRRPANAAELGQMISDCDKILSQQTPPHVTNEMAEARLAAAEQLWQARVKACGNAASEQDEPLRLIVAKLARS